MTAAYSAYSWPARRGEERSRCRRAHKTTVEPNETDADLGKDLLLELVLRISHPRACITVLRIPVRVFPEAGRLCVVVCSVGLS